MSETAVLAAVAARVGALAAADEVYVEAPDPLPRVHQQAIVVIRRDDTGLLVTPLTLGYDRWEYGVEIVAYLGGPSSGRQPVGARLAALAPALAAAWTADPTLGGTVVEARYGGDTSNLTTYRAAKEPPALIGRLRIVEWVPR